MIDHPSSPNPTDTPSPPYGQSASPGAGSEGPPADGDPGPDVAAPLPLAFRAVRGGLWLVGSSYWSLAFGFVANVLLTRLLTPETYGEFALAMFFVTLFQLRGKLGLNYAFAQQRSITGDTLGTLYVLDVLLGFGGLVLTLVAAPILLNLGYASMVVLIAVVMAALTFAESLLGTFGIVLETTLHFKPSSIIGSVAMPLSYIPAFWLATHGAGQYSLLAQAVTVSLLSMAAGFVYLLFAQRSLFHLRWRFHRDLATTYVHFGAMTGVGNFLAGMVMQVDNFILGTISGVTTLGYYDRAYRLAQWPALLLNAVVGRAAVFTYSQLRDDSVRLQKSSSMMFWIAATLATPMALALFLSAPDLVPLLYGTQWLPVVPILRILLIASVLRPIWENAGALFVGMGKPRRVIEISVVQLAAIFLIGAPLTTRTGATGMAVSVVFALLAGLAVAFVFLRRSLHLELRDTFIGPTLAAGLTLLVYWVVVRFVGSSYPLWIAAIWKIGFALLSFTAFSAIVQPRKFHARANYILRLLRGRSSAQKPQL